MYNINQYFSKLINEKLQERSGRAGTGGVFSYGLRGVLAKFCWFRPTLILTWQMNSLKLP